MPILAKNNRRIFFSHIPKTGGTSIYLAFAAAGWSICNLSENRAKGSAFSLLRETHDVRSIPRHGRMFRYPHPRQHAPHAVWRTWGPFDDSFAVVRHPMDRLKSALKYHHRISGSTDSLNTYATRQLRAALARPWSHWRVMGGHMVPQTAFLGSKTHVFRFDSTWQEELCARYDLNIADLPLVNVSPATGPLQLPADLQAQVEKRYARDYHKFGYEMAPKRAAFFPMGALKRTAE